MRQSGNGQVVPANVPGEDLTPENMSEVTRDDWADIRRMARGYCRTIDATRSRKRMDGSATIIKSGYAPYGTDDVSDDVTQDAVIMFAGHLRDVTKSCPVAAQCVETRETHSWLYTRKDGQEVMITRRTIQGWAVRNACRRNGYRLDVEPDETDATPGAQHMRALPHADNVASLPTPSAASEASHAAFRMAWLDGEEYPTLRTALFQASGADDLGRAGILAGTAQALHGGCWNSSRIVERTRRAGAYEWAELSARLADARRELGIS